jgi:hypothetical protein
MSELAGMFGDGVNLHSSEEDLAGLIEVVREAAGADTALVTVEAPMERAWLDGSSRAEMVDLGVDRLILKWRGATDPVASIEKAGELIPRS